MNSNTSIFIKKINKNWNIIGLIILAVLIITSLFTFSQPLKYRSTSKLIVVQEYSGVIDPYSASKSTRYLSDILSQVISTTSFFDQVLGAGFNVDKNKYGTDPQQVKKNWEKTTDVNVLGDTGIMQINTYSADKNQAEQINRAIVYTLKSKHSLYHGGGESVSIRTIEDPINTKWPVRPNIALNYSFGLLLGIFLALGLIYISPYEKVVLWKRKPKHELNLNEQYIQPTAEENVEIETEEPMMQNENQGSMSSVYQPEVVYQTENSLDDLIGQNRIETTAENMSGNEEITPEENQEVAFNRGDMGQFFNGEK